MIWLAIALGLVCDVMFTFLCMAVVVVPKLTFSMFDRVRRRRIARLRLAALIDGDHAELNPGPLHQPDDLQLQRFVAARRSQHVHLLPVLCRAFLLLDQVVGYR